MKIPKKVRFPKLKLSVPRGGIIRGPIRNPPVVVPPRGGRAAVKPPRGRGRGTVTVPFR